ncbi:hypothetical protein MMB68_10490 [Priestia sp. Y58]|nr:hypothetical protein [Priestia sp. Y58]MDG0029983.1 hypothetical protein [Priestia sp. Y58]
MNWTAYYTAIDFRARLRFARKSTARRNETDKTIFTITKNEPLIKHVD